MSNLVAIILQKKDVFFTFLSLILNRSLDAILLLVITPFLLKVFGIELYGEVAYFIVIVFFIQTIVSYGFENYIIYKISENNDYSEVLSKIFVIKLLLLLILSLFYCLYLYLYLNSVGNKEIYPYILLLLPLSECFNFSHFFVAKKIASKLVNYSLLRLIVFCLLILFFVKDKSSVNMYAYSLGVSYFISVLAQNYYLYTTYQIRFKLQITLYVYIDCLIDSGKFFVLKLIQTVSDRLYILYAGIFLSFSIVSNIDVLFKLYTAMLMPAQILMITLLPKFITKEYKFSFKILFFILMLCILIFPPITYYFSDNIHYYFFHEKNDSSFSYSIMVFAALFFIGNYLITELFINPNGMINSAVITSGFIIFITLLVLMVLWFFGMVTYLNLIFIFVCSKLLDLLAKIYISYKWCLSKNKIAIKLRVCDIDE